MLYVLKFHDDFDYFNNKTFVIKSEDDARSIKQAIDLKVDELNNAVNHHEITDTEYYRQLEDFLYDNFTVIRHKVIDLSI